MSELRKKKPVQQLLDEGAVLEALRVGSKRAVRLHKLMGNPVATVKDGKIVEIPPEEIQIDDTPAAS